MICTALSNYPSTILASLLKGMMGLFFYGETKDIDDTYYFVCFVNNFFLFNAYPSKMYLLQNVCTLFLYLLLSEPRLLILFQ